MLYSVSKFAILKLALRKGETRESWWSKVQDLQLIFWPGKPDYRKGKPGESQGRKVMGLKADACLHVSERTARQPKRQNQRKLATQSRGSKVVFHNLTMTARQPKSAAAQRPLGSVPSAFLSFARHTPFIFTVPEKMGFTLSGRKPEHCIHHAPDY